MPLDRTGAVPGRLSLRYATRTGASRRNRVLLALTGGPGQPGVVFGPSYADAFRGLLDDHSLVVLDQRGTGRSHPLGCPGLQDLRPGRRIRPELVLACAERVGPARNAFASADTVEDIEALRRRLGAERLALYGVSYGTWVAQEYARRHPDRVERLVLDSVVASLNDPWGTAVTRALPRVLRHLCAPGRCAAITRDPVGDLAAVADLLRDGRRLRGRVGTRTGARRRAALSQSGLLAVLVASDVNPALQARVPAALRAARDGDPVPLLRLRRDAAGPVVPLRDFSAGLFLTTTCSEHALPYSYADPVEERSRKAAAALAALPDAAIAPFDRAALDVDSIPQVCLRWPAGPARGAGTAPLPAAPSLVLAGLTDLRTPAGGGRRLARQIPGARVVALSGAGHDVVGSDSTGCVRRAIGRFLSGRAVGAPCRGRTVAPRLEPPPPGGLGDVAGVPGVPGARGRVLRAALATLEDASRSEFSAYYAGFPDTGGGGLRGGSYASLPRPAGRLLVLRRLSYVPGVRATGSVLDGARGFRGRVRMALPGGAVARVRFRNGRIEARIGGATVRTSVGRLRRTGRPGPAGRRRAAPRPVP